ncbi:MAG: hypothetical protein HYV08_00145 [Deltaproteobacteria bacterium]|nr:hypothetical protein [Deltaproteobacteria bacterium]
MIELTLTFRPAALPLARQELQCLPADGPRAALDLGLPLALQELVRNYLEEVPAAELPDGQRQAVEEAVARMRQDIWVTYRKPGREGGYLTLRTESIRPRDEDTVSFAPALRVRVRGRVLEFHIAPPVPQPEMAIAPPRYELPAGPEGAGSLLLDLFEARCDG